MLGVKRHEPALRHSQANEVFPQVCQESRVTGDKQEPCVRVVVHGVTAATGEGLELLPHFDGNLSPSRKRLVKRKDQQVARRFTHQVVDCHMLTGGLTLYAGVRIDEKSGASTPRREI